MNKRERQLEEDRGLRNSARAVFRNELDHVRQIIAPTAIKGKLAAAANRRAEATAEEALSFARQHWRKAAAGAAAIAAGAGLWAARKQIASGARKVKALIGRQASDSEAMDETTATHAKDAIDD